MKDIKSKYQMAKGAKVGEQCICPSCGTKFTKTNYQQAFCKAKGGTKCKDKYWNTVVETKRCNTTRISSANRAWMSKQKSIRKEREDSIHYWENDHPFSIDALGQWD